MHLREKAYTFYITHFRLSGSPSMGQVPNIGEIWKHIKPISARIGLLAF